MAIVSGCSINDNSSDSYYSEYPNNEMPYNEKYKDYDENQFLNTAEAPISTFSVDADGGSYTNMRRYLSLGQLPPKASVRIEEYLNYFTYSYSEPTDGENISINTEISPCYWQTDHMLMRIGIKGKTIAPNDLPPSNYVFLIDVSGSMSTPDKIGILKAGFKALVDNLGDQDRVAIVTYASNAGTALESTPCDEKQKIHDAIDRLMTGGSTAGGAGIEAAYAIAEKYYIPNGNNRIIIGSDGDFNVGMSSAEEVTKMIEEYRDKGIYITTLGVGGGNYNDHMMEQIANKGNGTYEYIDKAEQFEKVFIHEKSKLYTIAKDVKIQLTFDPQTVESYRLIGYENRALENEDFEDDKKDAGEIGVAQTITALYEVVLKKDGKLSPYAKLDVRYKKPNEDNSRLLSKDVSPSLAAVPPSGDQRFAAAVAAYGMILKESKFSGNADKSMILDLANLSQFHEPDSYRTEFVKLVEKSNIK